MSLDMEKLIKLLDEYEWEEIEHWYIDWDIRRRVRNFDNEKNTWRQVSWETKRFGFIKWLVDNDKIDKDKLYKSEYKPYFWNRTTNAFSWFWAEDILLMLLSISDTPIDDLISYLK